MRKPILILSPDPDVYGSYRAAEAQIQQYVYRLIIGGITDDNKRQVNEILESGEVSTVITRGLWYNYLLESEYMRANPHIHVDQLVIDTRVMLAQLSQFSESGFRRIGMISINSPFGFDPPDITSTHTLGNISVRKFCIFDISDPARALEQFLEGWDCDLLYGDINNIPIANIPCVPFKVRGKALQAMIKNAVNYDNSLQAESRRKSLYQFLTAMTNTVSESVILFNDQGAVLSNNQKSVRTFACSDMSGKTIQELMHMELGEIMSLQVNSLITINEKNYIVNILQYALDSNEIVHSMSLSSVRSIENTEYSLRTQLAKRGYKAHFTFDDIYAEDPASIQAKKAAQRFARFNETVLITGETGTGKELYASAIHNQSLRKDGPFVAINCAAISESLIESELFGYEKGAFTGASNTGYKGLFEQAQCGTIFLDEIGELPLAQQSKLLRVLQEKQVRRLGGTSIIPTDVRVIAATNRDLRLMCEQQRFRYDLYYRLSVLDLYIPPLRERTKDIVPLFKYFLQRYSDECKCTIYWKNDDVFDELLSRDWPGNGRELENVAMRTVILADGNCLTSDDIRRGLRQGTLSPDRAAEAFSTAITPDLEALDKAYIEYLLKRMGNSQSRVCAYLNISRSTLWRKLRRKEG